MPDMQVDHTYRVAFWNMCDGQAGINVRYYRCTARSATPLTVQGFADAISTRAAPLYKDIMASPADYWGVEVRDLSDLTAATVYSGLGRGAGTRPVNVAPLQVCGLISLRTDFIGRANRGRAYLPFPSLDDSTGDVPPKPDADYLTNANSIKPLFVGSFTYVDLANPLLTASVNSIINHASSVSDPVINNGLVREAWATQRRRGALGRPNVPPF